MRFYSLISTRYLVLSLTIFLFNIFGCGSETNFSGKGFSKTTPKELPAEPAPTVTDEPLSTPEPSETPPEPIVTPEPNSRLLLWDWPCENTYAINNGDTIEDHFVGPGPHQLSLDQTQDDARLSLSIQGEICHPNHLPRDIIFIIDKSNSMDTNDKYDELNKTCGRYRAVKEVINIFPKDGTVRFGIVMFDYAPVKYRSTALFSDEQTLFKDLAPSVDIQTVLCSHSGTTEYNSALIAAEDLLKTGRPGAFKEIYFVSDGEPDTDYPDDPCPNCDGAKDAIRLKTEGVVVGGEQILVTIATVLIGNYQGVLEKDIASVDKFGHKLHATISNSAELAKTLAGFAKNNVEKGVFKIKNSNENVWYEKDLQPLLNPVDYTFQIPAMELNQEDLDAGSIEFGIEYFDTKGSQYNYFGIIDF